MAETLYYNGAIITMRGGRAETVEAVLTNDGIIRAVGSLEEAMRASKEEEPELRNLRGMTMLPAFIDPHSHITAVARTLSLAALKTAEDFEGIVNLLKDYQTKNEVKPGDWIIGSGYDHNKLKEGRHPDRFILDQIFGENPVLISHASGHMGVANSAALAEMGITAKTADPQGGRIGRVPGTKEPDGYLEEAAFTSAGSVIPEPEMEQLLRQLAMAEQVYLEHGITTVQDGRTGKEEWNLLSCAARRGALQVDTVAYAEMKDAHGLIAENPSYAGGYRNHLRIGGYKIFLDGSPQGKTAWMTSPYLGEPEGYCGYPIYKDREVRQFFKTALQEGRQLLVHCNGDAAAQQMIDACRDAASETGLKPAYIRPVMIHAQLVREDQMAEMARLSITASFFTAHTWYWGDVHLKNFGESRAFKISPAKTAIREGVNVTFHQDSPVIMPDMIETIWCAVNRMSREGRTIGSLERVTPYEALKAVTVNAAYQYEEEAEKGTIEEGKRADFVILSGNPLEIEAEAIKTLHVLETIKDGKTLYRKNH